MSTTDVRSKDPSEIVSVKDLDMKVEVVVVPVSDVDRAKEFYGRLGWRLDVTPPAGRPVHAARLGVLGAVRRDPHVGRARFGQGVPDRLRPRGRPDALVAAGIEVGEIFHISPDGPVSGPDPEHRSYFSRAVFSDPDGNEWLLQEITTRLPGRVEAAATSFGSASDLAGALRRAAAAHGEHEKRTGERDEDWPSWYAAYMVAEQAGTELPT